MGEWPGNAVSALLERAPEAPLLRFVLHLRCRDFVMECAEEMVSCGLDILVDQMRRSVGEILDEWERQMRTKHKEMFPDAY